ncbi:MAG: homoserine kinase [Bacteroidota bacterium]|nr:homoserine kinase [Candidatus Kapabacteria bacterium]MDW8220657.1 homoserine kinase [Bacteroidota bacterium]
MKAAYQEATAFAPATVANVACGFDVLGFALESPGDEVTVHVTRKPGVQIIAVESDNGLPTSHLPLHPHKNTAGGAILALLEGIQAKFGVEVHIRKRMPAGSGMGSSAASAAAAVVAVNALLEEPLALEQLVDFGMKGEAIASGSEHADNVAPAIIGGIVLIRGYHPIDLVRIDPPNNLYCTIIRPHCAISTKAARELLPKQIPLQTAITQWGNLAGLIAGLIRGDDGLIARSLHDVIVEPYRAALIPGFYALKEAALNAGALGCSISGSGPSLFALSTSENIARAVGTAMYAVCADMHIDSTVYVSRLAHGGSRVLSVH